MFTIKLQARDHARIGLTSAGFAFCIMLVSLFMDRHNLPRLSGDIYREELFNDIFIPLVIAFPSFYVMFWKIVELGKAKKILEELAYTDSLTGALNRRAFQARCEQMLQTGQNGSFALMVIDLDHFKTINDSMGHDVGDQALVAVADTISDKAQPGALFGRIGGEEFVLFMAKTNASVAMLGAEQIRLAIETCDFNARKLSGSLTTSIGLAVSDEPRTYLELYREADACLYKAKAAGRNRVIHTKLTAHDRQNRPSQQHHSYAI